MLAGEINTMTVATAWLQARLCAEHAARALSDDERRLFIDMRNSWIQAANDMQLRHGARRARRVRSRRAAARR
jgi:hypothetical protein